MDGAGGGEDGGVAARGEGRVVGAVVGEESWAAEPAGSEGVEGFVGAVGGGGCRCRFGGGFRGGGLGMLGGGRGGGGLDGAMVCWVGG